MSKKLHFIYKMKLEFSGEVREHYFILRCIPRSNDIQKIISIDYNINPLDSLEKDMDCFGNITYTGKAIAPHKEFGFEVEGKAIVEYGNNNCAFNPIYKYNSKLTIPSKAIIDFVEQKKNGSFEDFGDDNLQKAIFLMNNLYENFIYMPGTTSIDTTAKEAFDLKKGVCQDYAHILISMCRYCNIPARYVVGMMLGEGATHAWVEIYDRNNWIAIDPTHNRIVNNDYIKLSNGRDYNDCMVDYGLFYGNTNQEQTVYVKVEELE